MRNKNLEKRTTDPNFSYLLFGNSFSKDHFSIQDNSSFGSNSLIEEVFLNDGYIGSIGNVFEHFTEIHYIEKLLKVDYRYDKIFKGESISKNKRKIATSSTFFCANYSFKYEPSLQRFKNDIKKSGLIDKWVINDRKFFIEVIKFKSLYEFIKQKLKIDKEYLWKN